MVEIHVLYQNHRTIDLYSGYLTVSFFKKIYFTGPTYPFLYPLLIFSDELNFSTQIVVYEIMYFSS